MLDDSINAAFGREHCLSPHAACEVQRPQNLPAYNPLLRMRASARKGKPSGR